LKEAARRGAASLSFLLEAEPPLKELGRRPLHPVEELVFEEKGETASHCRAF
jgi:hypothetical protein